MNKTIFITAMLMLTASIAFAHNGKIAYAYNSAPKTIDAKSSDWAKESWYPIGDLFGTPISSKGDLNGRFKIAYNLKEKSLYLLVEIIDDSWTKDDFYEFYINGIHQAKKSGVVAFRFRKDSLNLLVHPKFKDPYHSFISKKNITFKSDLQQNKLITEIKLELGDLLSSNKTLGFDHFIQDVDNDKPDRTYANWGIGYNGFWKEYNSGQLGDVVLLENEPKFGQVSGSIKWKGLGVNEQNVIKIQSEDNADLWVSVKLDSLGNFSQKLPVGSYRLSPMYETTHPFSGDGYGNQLRVDTHFYNAFTIEESGMLDLNSITIPVFEEASYLFQEKGAIHNLDIGALESFIKTQMTYYNVPGASIAVIKNGNIVYSNEFGYRSNLTKAPINENTHFQAASVTKAVFAFIVNRIVDQGKFNLDTPLYTLLPFENYSEDDRYKKITGRMVLNHTSGMPNWAFGGPGGWKSGAKGKLLFEPGSKFSYSGEAFEYLSRVIEKITQKNLNTLLEEEVINALGTPTIYFSGNETIEMAQGHLQGDPTYWFGYNEEPGVAHSMLTNARRFAYFVKALANQKGLSEKQYSQMFERTVLAPGFPMSPDYNYWNLGMGLGFFVQDTVEGKAVMHGGSNYDFQSEFVLYPKSKNGFVIFTNSNTGHKLGQAVGKYLFYGGRKKTAQTKH